MADEDNRLFTEAMRDEPPDLTSSVLFHEVTYLGSASVNAPRSEEEIQKNMSILNEQSKLALDVTLCVPDNAEGLVRLLDPVSELEITSYRISEILFCTRAPSTSPLSCCWAFSTSHASTLRSQSPSEIVYQCQVFRCHNEDAIYRILLSFTNAFRRSPSTKLVPSRRPISFLGQALQATVGQLQQQSSMNINGGSTGTAQQVFDGSIKYRCYFEIKEENLDGKGNSSFTSVSRLEKNVFRLRKDVRKLLLVTLEQTRGFPLTIERCFGLLLAQGRNVPASDMQLLDLETMSKSDDHRYTIRAHWDPSARAFKHLTHLNEETAKGARIFFTVALDLVISGIYEPVRFLIEAKARVSQWKKGTEGPSQDLTETIWSSFKKMPTFVEEFDLILKQGATSNAHQEQTFKVITLESKSQSERHAKSRRLSSMTNSSSTADDETDETIVSGSGQVSKECDEDVLTNWKEILIKWKKNYSERPRGLQLLVQQGVPQALRCEVWQLLAGSIQNESEMIENYRLLVTKTSSSERVIINDLDRTFPAHEYFKTGAVGQEALYKLSRAYSVRDEEVGYCQGLSFVIATLLIHIPEEQAFVLLCRLMEDQRYELRELYKANFESLQLRFYQLSCLIEENLCDLAAHFDDLKIECHMFASQWFLTLFTAKFPLYLVFRIIDLFLYDGFNAIFAVALALLKCNQKDLLSLDFEGVMRFFRVNLPKKYLCETSADELIQSACSIKINQKKLKRYEKDYFQSRYEEEEKVSPLQRLETENKRLTESSLRSELENEILALELVNDRVQLKGNLHQAEDRIENLLEELQSAKLLVRQSEDLTLRLDEELKYIRQAFQETCDELQRTQKELKDSKQRCFQLNEQKNKWVSLQSQCCESCQSFFASLDTSTNDPETNLQQIEQQLTETKLALTEALYEKQECLRHMASLKKSDTHPLISPIDDPNSGSWLTKTVQTIKESTTRTRVN